eukprot:m.32682 g.32682  ORF g.32682 m.32682 type:complete len:92 (-) comp10103_c0_seq1:289-564(-)
MQLSLPVSRRRRCADPEQGKGFLARLDVADIGGQCNSLCLYLGDGADVSEEMMVLSADTLALTWVHRRSALAAAAVEPSELALQDAFTCRS